ncbi:MAG: peptide chain release factor N(5)-glutamine methyltransferase [Planctomycetota bacterium]
MSWTITRVLAWSADYLTQKGSASPKLDADLLLADVLGIERVHLYTDPDRPLQPGELAKYREHIARRATGFPLAYQLGHREFYSRRFEVGPGVLVPRPETELLIDVALEHLPEHEGEGEEVWACDVGTGSGNIAITLAAEREHLNVLAIDMSEKAIEYATKNASALDVADRVRIVRGDRLEPVRAQGLEGKLALIVSNPPYVSKDDRGRLGFGVERHEPNEALFPESDPLSFYKTFAAEAPRLLKPGGWLVCEVGQGQAEAVAKLFEATLTAIDIRKDLAGIARVVAGRSGC